MPAPVPDRPNFQPGANYVRKELHDGFKGNRQKGISAPADEDFVFIFTGPSGKKYGYNDRFEDDETLIYYGEGRTGDMEFTENNGNTKIRDQQERGLSLYVFEEADEDGVVSYAGEYEYSDHDWVTIDDENNRSRQGIEFELVPV